MKVKPARDIPLLVYARACGDENAIPTAWCALPRARAIVCPIILDVLLSRIRDLEGSEDGKDGEDGMDATDVEDADIVESIDAEDEDDEYVQVLEAEDVAVDVNLGDAAGDLAWLYPTLTFQLCPK